MVYLQNVNAKRYIKESLNDIINNSPFNSFEEAYTYTTSK